MDQVTDFLAKCLDKCLAINLFVSGVLHKVAVLEEINGSDNKDGTSLLT